jgi:hypothetical protein
MNGFWLWVANAAGFIDRISTDIAFGVGYGMLILLVVGAPLFLIYSIASALRSGGRNSQKQN